MCSPGINGEGELRGQPANLGSPGKWPLKPSVCVRACVCVCDMFLNRPLANSVPHTRDGES